MTKSTISEELTITGNIRGSGSIDVRGSVVGDIETQVIDILAGGSVEGNVRVETAHVRGSLKGGISAKSVDLHAQADVEADVTAGELTSEKGARLRGKVSVGQTG